MRPMTSWKDTKQYIQYLGKCMQRMQSDKRLRMPGIGSARNSRISPRAARGRLAAYKLSKKGIEARGRIQSTARFSFSAFATTHHSAHCLIRPQSMHCFMAHEGTPRGHTLFQFLFDGRLHDSDLVVVVVEEA